MLPQKLRLQTTLENCAGRKNDIPRLYLYRLVSILVCLNPVSPYSTTIWRPRLDGLCFRANLDALRELILVQSLLLPTQCISDLSRVLEAVASMYDTNYAQ